MLKYILTALMIFVNICLYSQNSNSIYFHKPFPIYKSVGQVIIAGDLNTVVYSDYYGKDVKKEGYSNPHSKPEYLIYELFKDMKNKDLYGLNKLYDTSFKEKKFDRNRMADIIRSYTDIKFQSKFRSGDLTIVRYDFVSSLKRYEYFAAIREIENNYYLTMDINVSDPFNLIGSFSPYNLFERAAEAVNIKNMTAFYFINKQNKVFFTNELPNEDYSSVYLAFDFYNERTTSSEIDFVKQLQKAAMSEDSSKIKNLIAINELPLLADLYFKNYYYFEIRKIFMNYSQISPLATIKTNDGKILYFKYSNNGQSSNIASILLKESGGKYYLSLRITDNDINNILQNIYIREAIYDYLKRRQ